jgi:hypothetical protein
VGPRDSGTEGQWDRGTVGPRDSGTENCTTRHRSTASLSTRWARACTPRGSFTALALLQPQFFILIICPPALLPRVALPAALVVNFPSEIRQMTTPAAFSVGSGIPGWEVDDRTAGHAAATGLGFDSVLDLEVLAQCARMPNRH